jgi:hypothetical protein
MKRRITGRGAYNSLINNTETPVQMAHSHDETGSITIINKEYIKDVFSLGTAFQCQQFSVNPGLALFPFLSQLAENYSKYTFDQLIFYYVPTVANVTATGQLGVTIMVFDYNAGDPTFTSKTQMLGYSGAINAIISEEIAMGVECDRHKGGVGDTYVRSGAVPVGQDVKSYDVGTLNVATAGINATSFPSGTQIGELWVYYKCKLMQRKLFASLGGANNVDQFEGHTGINTTTLFGTAPNKASTNGIGGQLSKIGTTIYTLPDQYAGVIHISLAYTGTVFVGTPGLSIAGNLVNYPIYDQGGILNNYLTSTNSTSSTLIETFTVSPSSTSGGNYISFTAGGLTYTTITSASLTISEFNPGCATTASQFIPV